MYVPASINHILIRHATHPHLILSQVLGDEARNERGYDPANTALPTADHFFVRAGVVAHFDLRVTAASPAGQAILKAFNVESLSNAQAKVKIVEELRLEIASHDRTTKDTDHQLAVQLQAE